MPPSDQNTPPFDPNPTATAGNTGTSEETYKKLSEFQSILLRPESFLGSFERQVESHWIYNARNELKFDSISYVPALYTIFDEILVNAADNFFRSTDMDLIKVDIRQEENWIMVYNNGKGIPVEFHNNEGRYIPELIFALPNTSSNFNDDAQIATGGRNGLGAKLANLCSKKFEVETSDGKNQYKQVFRDNNTVVEPPTLSVSKATGTTISFKPDLEKFGMVRLEDDVVSLMRKRVLDLAGCLSRHKVKVSLNGKEISFKSFHEYAQLHLDLDTVNPLPRIDNSNEKDSKPRWQISVSLSDGQFQQASFVNCVHTINGGTHVEYILDEIVKFAVDVAKKKKRDAKFNPHAVIDNLWVFLNAEIVNPTFESQLKNTLTTPKERFAAVGLSEDFLKQVVENCGLVERLIAWADCQDMISLKRSDGSKSEKLVNIPNLEDANDAGGSNSKQCTLILTEGDSAKALALAGLSVVGRDLYGVFALRGKILNVRTAREQRIKNNKLINYLKKVLGLKDGEDYEKERSFKQLRYGKLMIMTDQDHDGYHITGLIINFLHKFWPALLKRNSFLFQLITPILKATPNGKGINRQVECFYSMPEYHAWWRKVGSDKKNWTIKYYKGLGTSDANEGKQYFASLESHKKSFVWEDLNDDKAINEAFGAESVMKRKKWLMNKDEGSLDQKAESITYKDFIHMKLTSYFRAAVQRTIPSLVDGLKPAQRKVLFSAFKKELVNETQVDLFSGYVAEVSSYHHAEASIQNIIIDMAQCFVGSNNINLFMPHGQFGTRIMGGKDAGSTRYLNTKLTKIARFIFPKEDDVLLKYLEENGLTIEPVWYVPILPMVLVNGAKGIGVGLSTDIPKYSITSIIANIKHHLKNEEMVSMLPWYNKFKGTVEKVKQGDTFSYTLSGILEVVDAERVDLESYCGDVTVRITELPPMKWIQGYKKFLLKLAKPDKAKEPFIKGFSDYSTDETVYFEILLSKTNYNKAKSKGLMEIFELTTSLSTSNMHLLDENGKIVKVETPEKILEKFCKTRLEYYTNRKKHYLEKYQTDLDYIDNQVRFINGVLSGEIVFLNKEKAEVVNELRNAKFTSFPKSEAMESYDELEDSSKFPGLRDYDYLLHLPIVSLTRENVQVLHKKRNKIEDQLQRMKEGTELSLWYKDLEAFENALKEKERTENLEAQDNVVKDLDRLLELAKGKGKAPVEEEERTENLEAEHSVVKDLDHHLEQTKGKGKAPVKVVDVVLVEGENCILMNIEQLDWKHWYFQEFLLLSKSEDCFW